MLGLKKCLKQRPNDAVINPIRRYNNINSIS